MSWQNSLKILSLSIIAALFIGPASLVAQAANTWDGGSTTSDNWSDGINWDNDLAQIFPVGIAFDGTTWLTPSNDLSNLTVKGIAFNRSASAFNLSGNGVTLGGTIDDNSTTQTQIINLNLGLGATQTINVVDATAPGTGALKIGGVISASRPGSNGNASVSSRASRQKAEQGVYYCDANGFRKFRCIRGASTGGCVA